MLSRIITSLLQEDPSEKEEDSNVGGQLDSPHKEHGKRSAEDECLDNTKAFGIREGEPQVESEVEDGADPAEQLAREDFQETVHVRKLPVSSWGLRGM